MIFERLDGSFCWVQSVVVWGSDLVVEFVVFDGGNEFGGNLIVEVLKCGGYPSISELLVELVMGSCDGFAMA